MDRFKKVMEGTRDKDIQLPPIEVKKGSNGLKVKDVKFSYGEN